MFGLYYAMAQARAAYLPSFSWYPRPRRKCKVGENAILGLSRTEMVRNTCFYIKYSLIHLWSPVLNCPQNSNKVQFLFQPQKHCIIKYLKNTKLYSVEFLKTKWEIVRPLHHSPPPLRYFVLLLIAFSSTGQLNYAKPGLSSSPDKFSYGKRTQRPFPSILTL